MRNEINEILELLSKNNDISTFVDNVGTLKEKIGSTYYIKPFNIDLKTISITIINDTISSFGITYNIPVSLYDVELEFSQKAIMGYNWHDNYTAFFLTYKNNKIILERDGYLELTDQTDVYAYNKGMNLINSKEIFFNSCKLVFEN